MSQTLIILSTCIESGYFSKADVESWANEWIYKLPYPPVWLMDLMDAEVEAQELKILSSESLARDLPTEDGYPELLLRFYYLRFLADDIQLNDFESLVVDVVDAYDVVGFDPELINKLLKKPISIEKAKEVSGVYFKQYGCRSKKGYLYMTSSKVLEKEPSLFSE